MCPASGISYDEPAPHSFSFNSPQGACPHCSGLGHVSEIDNDKIIPDPSLSIKKGGIYPLGPYKNSLIFWQLDSIASKYGFSINTPVGEIPEEAMSIILYGSDEPFKLQNTPLGNSANYFLTFEGVLNYIQNHNGEENSRSEQKWANQFIRKVTCSVCGGTRLRKEALFFRMILLLITRNG